MTTTLSSTRGDCLSCIFGQASSCDHHTPPVCVCDHPKQGWMNECGSCHRPYGPRFAEVREAWRDYLGEAADR